MLVVRGGEHCKSCGKHVKACYIRVWLCRSGEVVSCLRLDSHFCDVTVVGNMSYHNSIRFVLLRYHVISGFLTVQCFIMSEVGKAWLAIVISGLCSFEHVA